MVGKGVVCINEFDTFANVLNKMLVDILNEYFESVPSSLVSSDFGIMYLKIRVAKEAHHICADEMYWLYSALADCEKLWKKLNDV